MHHNSDSLMVSAESINPTNWTLHMDDGHRDHTEVQQQELCIGFTNTHDASQLRLAKAGHKLL